MAEVILNDNLERCDRVPMKEAPRCFKCDRYMSLIEASNGKFWVCEGPHWNGQWNCFRAKE